jgi:hypothetical protein
MLQLDSGMEREESPGLISFKAGDTAGVHFSFVPVPMAKASLRWKGIDNDEKEREDM